MLQCVAYAHCSHGHQARHLHQQHWKGGNLLKFVQGSRYNGITQAWPLFDVITCHSMSQLDWQRERASELLFCFMLQAHGPRTRGLSSGLQPRAPTMTATHGLDGQAMWKTKGCNSYIMLHICPSETRELGPCKGIEQIGAERFRAMCCFDLYGLKMFEGWRSHEKDIRFPRPWCFRPRHSYAERCRTV